MPRSARKKGLRYANWDKEGINVTLVQCGDGKGALGMPFVLNFEGK